jgi:thymidine phosphorylase
VETFERMIEAQGGDPRVVADYSQLPAAPDRHVMKAASAGFVAGVRAELIGRASNALGAGRNTVGDAVDHAVGIRILAQVGDAVTKGQPLLELHHRGGRGLDTAIELSTAAVVISDAPPTIRPTILGEVR